MLKSINQRLLFYIVLLSSAVTIMLTSAQVYIDYRYEIAEIEAQFEQIQVSYLTPLTKSLWDMDITQTRNMLQGIYSLSDMQYIGVKSEQEIIAELGKPASGEALERSFVLEYLHSGDTFRLGTLQVSATLEGVYLRLAERTITNLSANMILILSIACFLYWLFRQLVTRHLSYIADFASSLSLGETGDRLTLQRESSPTTATDELEQLAKAINSMQDNLEGSYLELAEKEQNYR